MKDWKKKEEREKGNTNGLLSCDAHINFISGIQCHCKMEKW